MNLGKAIKVCRAAKNQTLEKTATSCGISTSYLSRLENEDRDPPFSLVEKIAEALAVPMVVLMLLASRKEDLVGVDEAIQQQLSTLALKYITQ